MKPPGSDRRFGVLVISHGSGSGEWVRLVDEAVAGMGLPPGLPVVSSFLEIVEGRLIGDGLRELEDQGVTDIVTVPLFISSGSTHIDEIAYALGVIPQPALTTDLAPFDVSARIHFCQPVDDDPVIARILYGKLAGLSMNPEREIVLVVGHGSREKGFYTRWRRGLEGLAARVRELGGFAAADGAMLLPDQVPCKIKIWQKRRPGCDIIVAPLFLSEGYFTGRVIPERLAGFDCRYNGRALLPDPLISRWMERQIAKKLQAALGNASAGNDKTGD